MEVEVDMHGDAAIKMAAKSNNGHGNSSSSNHPQEPGMLAGYHNNRNLGSSSPPSSPGREQQQQQQHASETRELKGMAKMWDEEDRMAKKGARRGSGGAVANAAGTLTTSSNHSANLSSSAHNTGSVTSSHQALAPADANVRRLSEQDAKRRATYLSTGLKPGAYPDRGPALDPTEDTPENRRYSTSRQYATQISSDGMDKSTTVSSSKETDLEEGGNNDVYDNNGPLVEAFVVPDDGEVSTMPPPKAGRNGAFMVAGDSVQKPQKIPDDESVKVTDLLMHRNMLCLIGGLICCFVIAAVIVVVVVMVVVTPGNDSQGSAVSSSNNNMVDGSTMNPVATLLPELNDSETLVPLPENTTTVEDEDTNEDTVAGDGEEADDANVDDNADTPGDGVDEEADAEGNNEDAAIVEDTDTTDNTDGTTDANTEEVATETDPVETMEPTAAPVTIPEPTSPPTRPPTLPPTRSPTDPPVQEEEDTTEPTEAPKDDDSTVLATDSSPVVVEDPGTEATRKPYNPDNTVRMSFTVDYVINNLGADPSQEEQDLLDSAVREFFINAVESGGSTSSVMELDSSWVVSSSHATSATGWQQTVSVDFTFLNGLPPLETVVDSVTDNADIGNFLRNVVKKDIGPTFANTASISYKFDVQRYGDE